MPKGSVVTTVLSAIADIVREILRDDVGTLAPHTRFTQLEGWEPADLVSIVVETECRFGIQFELPEIDRLATVGDLVRMVTAKQALASA